MIEVIILIIILIVLNILEKKLSKKTYNLVIKIFVGIIASFYIINILSSLRAIIAVLIIIAILLFFYFLVKLIDRKTSDVFKIRLIKVSLEIGAIIMVAIFIAAIYDRFNPLNDFEELVINMVLIISFILFSFPGIMMIFFGNIKPPKPDKYLLKQDNYIDFSNYLNKRLLLNDYQEVYSEENLKIYKKIVKKNKHYIIDFKTEEFTEDIYNDLYDNKMVPIVEKDLKEMQNKMYRSLYVTYIISVDRLTSYFNHFIKGLDQDIRYFSLPVGISFGGNKIYIAAEIKGFEMSELKKMKKEVLEILEINKEKSGSYDRN